MCYFVYFYFVYFEHMYKFLNYHQDNLVDLYLNPSKIWIADSLWQIEKSHLHTDSTSIAIDNFSIHHNQERFRIYGKVTDNTTDKINIEFDKENDHMRKEIGDIRVGTADL